MLSGCIFTWTREPRHFDLTMRAINSYKHQLDELIIIEDGGEYKQEYVDNSSVYVYNSSNSGFTRSVNQGLKMATGDYIACISNDTYLISGNIQELCTKDTVVSPEVENQPGLQFAGSFFVVPRSIYDKVGGLDERMKVYYSDEDYIFRLKSNGIAIEKNQDVVIHHDIKQTVVDEQLHSREDGRVYDSIH